MGLLDDAIREHLELKRLRGADPNEIARQQHEALDPPGTEPVGGMEAVHVPEDPTIAEPPPAYERPPAYEPPPAATEPPPVYEPPPEPTTPPPAHVEASDAPFAPHHEAQPADDEPSPGDSFDMQTEPPVDSASVHQPTAEYAVEDLEALRDEPAGQPEPQREQPEPEHDRDDDIPSASEADADVAEEDVLDQTPEFLQETPEHDRLWFEQKPPRDFDF